MKSKLQLTILSRALASILFLAFRRRLRLRQLVVVMVQKTRGDGPSVHSDASICTLDLSPAVLPGLAAETDERIEPHLAGRCSCRRNTECARNLQWLLQQADLRGSCNRERKCAENYDKYVQFYFFAILYFSLTQNK